MELRIYEIPLAIRNALEAITIDEETGEIVGADKLDELTESAQVKIANTARYIRELDAQIVGMEIAADNMKKRINTAKKFRDFLAVRSVQAMLALPNGVRKIEEPDIRVGLRKSESVEITDEKKLAEKYIRTKIVTTTEPNKAEIKAAIKAGETVDGARLNTNFSLTIK